MYHLPDNIYGHYIAICFLTFKYSTIKYVDSRHIRLVMISSSCKPFFYSTFNTFLYLLFNI